jgi:putative DNA primase/helicase
MTYPSAPKGSAVQRWIDSMASIGVGYAGAISGGSGGKWACPIHDDEHPSLDVTVGRNGKPIFTCTPCQQAMGQDEFVEALKDAGVSWRGEPCSAEDVDWGPAAVVVKPSAKGGEGGVHLTATYSYNHADGKPNYRVKRYDPDEGSAARKHFVPKRFEAGKGWTTGLDGVERTPLYLDRFETWAKKPRPIYMVEGEKAAEALLAAKKPVTTFHGGSAGKVEPDWPTRYGFDRFTEVRLWPDADEAGVERMIALAHDLHKAGVPFSYWGSVEVAAKDDAYDVLARKKVPQPLTDADLDLLKALHPKPQVRLKEGATDRRVVVEVEGSKSLIGATGLDVAERVNDPRDEDADEPYTYATAMTQRPYAFAQEMIERHFTDEAGTLTLRFRADDLTFWFWNPAKVRYEHITPEELFAHCSALLDGSWETFVPKDDEPISRPITVRKPHLNEVLAHIGSLTLTSPYGAGSLLPSVGGVPFRNGWLDVQQGLLLPAGPERDIRWNIQADYKPDALCPAWERFLDSLGWVEGSEERRLLRQWLGYLLSGRKDQERGLLMLGPSRSGKGTILRVVHGLFGEGATGTSLDSIMQNFGLQNFIGKGVATIGDARFGRSDKGLNAKLLSLTSNDELPVDVKFGKPLSINLPVRLMIATNETPNFIEASDALGMRFVVLKFTKSFIGHEDKNLAKRLIGELPGIARWALAGLEDLDGEGRFSETTSGKEVQHRMVQESAFVRLFVEERCVLTGSLEDRVSNEDLYNAYAGWATSNGMPVYNSVKFARELLDAFPTQVESGSYRIGKRVIRGKMGLKLS